MEYTVIGYKCACRVIGNDSIDYCPLHKSAPDLYEACHIAINEIERLAMVTGYEGEAHYPRIAQIKQALSKVESK